MIGKRVRINKRVPIPLIHNRLNDGLNMHARIKRGMIQKNQLIKRVHQPKNRKSSIGYPKKLRGLNPL
jgi:hypothetical protein